MKKLLQIIAIALLTSFMFGCANSQIKALETDVETLKAQMKEVSAQAANAEATANRAEQTAADTNSKLDRMFKKSMMK